MNWKLKAHTLAVLSRMPGGRKAYHRLQQWAGTSRVEAEFEVRKATELHDLIVEAGGQLAGSHVLEIGTGWKPFVPVIFALCGAKCVTTLDVNPWLSLDYARRTLISLEPFLGQLAERFLCHEQLVRERFEKAMKASARLDSLFAALGIEYRCPADARATGFDERSIDLIVSSNVLEHIPPQILQGIHAESRRILRPGGLSVHRFNPEDHFADVDASITAVNFLQFSARQWHWYGGSGLAYHNRLRCVQHQKLLEESGLETLISRVRINHRALSALKDGTIRVDSEFTCFSFEELAADYMWTASRNPFGGDEPVERSGSQRILAGEQR